MIRFRRSAELLSLLLILSVPVKTFSSELEAHPTAIAHLDAQAAGFSSYVLPNGFKIILAPFPSASTVRVELLIKSGSKVEGYGETGMAHLLEHMLFKSAGQRASLKSDLTALGAAWNGTTSTDRTNFFETVAAEPEKVDEAIRIEADRFIRASFAKEDLASEMSVVRNELERNDSDSSSLVMRALQRQSYFWHGYSRPSIGARSDIEDAPFSALQAFHRKHYRPDNAVLIVSGNIDVPRVLTLASQQFAEAGNPAEPKPGSWTREETRATTSRSELFLPAGKTVAASAWRLPGMTERQTYAFDLGSNAICDDDWGSLNKELVLERKIAVAASCGTQIQADYSLLIGSATGGKDADAEVLSQALREHIQTAAAKGISQVQLERARLAELNAFERLENVHETLASFLSKAEVAGDWRLYFWQRDVVHTLTLDEVNAALKKWTVGVNRNDVLLRHAEGVQAPVLPAITEAKGLLAGKDWAPTTRLADPAPTSVEELAKATITIPLEGARAQAALISRRTQGDRAWIILDNDYGNESALSGRRIACAMANKLMAYGGGGLSRYELSARMEALQAQWSLGLGGIVLEAPRRNIDAALDTLLSSLTAPALPINEFESLKALTIGRLEANQKDPALVAASIASLRFDNFPVQHPFQPRSLEQQISESGAVSYADVAACAADFSGIAHVRLAMVGEFSREDVQAVWAKVARLPAAKIPYQRIKDVEAPSSVDTTPVNVAMPERPNAAIAGSTLLAISDESPDYPALRIAVNMLGGDADSRIWKRVREREGLAYSAGVTLSGNHFEPRSKLVIQASAGSNQADAAMSSLKEELALALKDGFTEQEVERAKRAWTQERKTFLRSEQSFAQDLAQGLYSGQDYAWLARYDQKIAKLTAPQVTSALRKYLTGAPIVWMIGRGS